MPLTCAQRWEALFEGIFSVQKQLKYEKLFLDHLRERVSGVKARVCGDPGNAPCCQTVTEWETAHPPTSAYQDAEAALLAAVVAFNAVNCGTTGWPAQCDAAEAALATAEAKLALWLAEVNALQELLLALVRDGCDAPFPDAGGEG